MACRYSCCQAERLEYEPIAEVWRKARKPHVCANCLAPIQTGETYKRLAYKVEGVFRLDTTHVACPIDIERGFIW